MDQSLTTVTEDRGPISPEWTTTELATSPTPLLDPTWTVAELLDWLSEDSRTHAPELTHPLAVIEHALTGSVWKGDPSTVAVIRSIADHVRRAPAALSVRLEELPRRG